MLWLRFCSAHVVSFTYGFGLFFTQLNMRSCIRSCSTKLRVFKITSCRTFKNRYCNNATEKAFTVGAGKIAFSSCLFCPPPRKTASDAYDVCLFVCLSAVNLYICLLTHSLTFEMIQSGQSLSKTVSLSG